MILPNYLLQEQEEQSWLRDEFFATVARELITPLSLIKVFSNSLLSRSHDQLLQDQLLDQINRHTAQLIEIITDWQDIFDVQGGNKTALHLEPVNMLELVNSLVMPVAALAHGKKVHLRCFSSSVPYVLADPFWLALAAQNLLSYAIEKAAASSTIEIRQRIFKASLVLSVAFDVHEELPPTPSKFRSCRIAIDPGLSGSEMIIKLHAGEMKIVCSRTGHRTFYVLLPLAEAA